MKNRVQDFFENSLQRMLQAEEDILEQLKALTKVSHSLELKKIFTVHAEETERQVDRLKKALEMLTYHHYRREEEESMIEKGKKAIRSIAKTLHFKSDAIDGIIREGRDVFREFSDTMLHDLVLASGAQAIEMGEIAAYKNLLFLGEICERRDINELLNQTLQEEQKAYDILRSFSNSEAEKVKKSA